MLKNVLFNIIVLFAIFMPLSIKAEMPFEIQKMLIEKVGYPGSFKVMILDDTNDKSIFHRLESWNYYRYGVSLTFYDNKYYAHQSIEDVTSLTFMPVQYKPEDFQTDMNFYDVKKNIIKEETYEHVNLLEELSSDIELIGLEQLILGFLDEKLIYVETVPLSLETKEEE